MDTSAGDSPERLLSSALRAQAAGNAGNAGSGSPAAEPSSPPRPESTRAQAEPAESRKLPVAEVLLFALMLGMLAGGLAGVLSL
jgi:hypothetical protein